MLSNRELVPRVVGVAGGGGIQGILPQPNISWYQAAAFCNLLTEKTLGADSAVYYSDAECKAAYTMAEAGKVSDTALDGKGNLTFTLSGEADGETIVRPVSIQSPNYEGIITATVTVALTDKLNQRPLAVKASSTTVAAGGTLELSTSGGSGKGAVTHEVIKGTGSASVSGSILTGSASGTVTVIAAKAGTSQYNPARSQPLVITIE